MSDVLRLVERLYREESGRILPTLIRILGDFTLAEESLQDAFESAIAQWPSDGVPETPRGWIIRVARNRAIDQVRRRARLEDRTAALEQLAALDQELEETPAIPDDQLRLLYTCCHPALAPEAQVALTLRTTCGLTTEEIAHAFLVPPATMGQRIVRAQRKIHDAKIPYELPEASQLRERTDAVLATVYLTFNEGYAATGGSNLVRIDLCEEAIRLGRVLVQLLPEHEEAAALLALMLLHHARRRARVAADGALVLLDRQDRSQWSRAEIDEGRAVLRRALVRGARGPYVIQAAIAALHAEAPAAEETDWNQIAGLYERLFQLQPTPVVALNRAAAVAMAHGAERGLAQIDDLEGSGLLRGYHLLPAARADLLRRLGRREEAASAYARAITLTRNDAERRYLEARLREMQSAAQ